jgi:hypothetical protein
VVGWDIVDDLQVNLDCRVVRVLTGLDFREVLGDVPSQRSGSMCLV